ncbi:MAG: MarR family transcriptional regulator [Alistipes sp.]|nr:MarR family transcriptional regulator [Alistipes sp.]
MYSRENQIGFYVRELGNILKKRRECDGCKDGFHLTMMQKWVLGYLVHHTDHDIYQKELEDNLNIGKSTLSEILRTMEKDGLVERVSSGRCKKIVMTEKSTQIDKAIMRQIETTEEKLREGLSGEETDTFIRIIKKMIENVKEECEK